MFSTLHFITALLAFQSFASAFAPHLNCCKTSSSLFATSDSSVDRRSFFSTISSAAILITTLSNPSTSFAAEAEEEAENKSVQTPLYNILRVREATEQEARLIKSGKFKDVQRANVKLAVKFMVDNYSLNDNFIAASAFLTGDKRMKAGDIGQNVVQNLYTILEYFDSGDVENIKVSRNRDQWSKENNLKLIAMTNFAIAPKRLAQRVWQVRRLLFLVVLELQERGSMTSYRFSPGMRFWPLSLRLKAKML